MRIDGRKADELRSIKITRNYIKTAEGSVLIEMGDTKVICTATIENSVPPFLRGKGTGWVTAEYAMLPRSSGQRIQRERSKVGGRTHEIQRLIGRSLRAVVDMAALGERSVLIDCDVIQADGGTRTASITGAYIALVDGLRHARRERTPPGLMALRCTGKSRAFPPISTARRGRRAGLCSRIRSSHSNGSSSRRPRV